LRRGEKLIEALLLASASASIIFFLSIIVFLIKESLPLFAAVSPMKFLFGTVWNPASAINPRYGVLPLLSGSLLVVGIALVIAIPISLASAIYLSEIAEGHVGTILRGILELLAGVPSVVYGFIALVILSGLLHSLLHTTYRLNALNGALILSIMILPTITSIASDAISSIPKEFREASLALGATRWQTIRNIVLPSAKRGIIVASMLGVGRAIGETMAVLMATGNSPIITLNPLRSVETMTAAIAIEMGEVVYGSLHYHALFAVGLLLFIISLLINLSAIHLGYRGETR